MGGAPLEAELYRLKGEALLAPILGWFEEGFDTADLKEAETLLDEIACAPGKLARSNRWKTGAGKP